MGRCRRTRREEGFCRLPRVFNPAHLGIRFTVENVSKSHPITPNAAHPFQGPLRYPAHIPHPPSYRSFTALKEAVYDCTGGRFGTCLAAKVDSEGGPGVDGPPGKPLNASPGLVFAAIKGMVFGS